MINQQRCRLAATQPRAGKPQYLSLRQIFYTGALCFISLILITLTYQRPATHRQLPCLPKWMSCCLPCCFGNHYAPLNDDQDIELGQSDNLRAPEPSAKEQQEQDDL